MKNNNINDKRVVQLIKSRDLWFKNELHNELKNLKLNAEWSSSFFESIGYLNKKWYIHKPNYEMAEDIKTRIDFNGYGKVYDLSKMYNEEMLSTIICHIRNVSGIFRVSKYKFVTYNDDYFYSNLKVLDKLFVLIIMNYFNKHIITFNEIIEILKNVYDFSELLLENMDLGYILNSQKSFLEKTFVSLTDENNKYFIFNLENNSFIYINNNNKRFADFLLDSYVLENKVINFKISFAYLLEWFNNKWKLNLKKWKITIFINFVRYRKIWIY